MKMSVGKKPSRAEAYALVLDMKTGRKPLEDWEVDQLLRYFAPALPKKARSPEQWVAKAAAGKYEVRKALQFIEVKNGVAYASDGHRAHRCKTTLADGYYDPATMIAVDSDERSIDIARIFPSRRDCKEFAIEDLEPGALPGKERDARPIEYLRVPDSLAVNRAYLLDAMNGAESGSVFYARGVMAGDSEFGDWVIMGLRL